MSISKTKENGETKLFYLFNLFLQLQEFSYIIANSQLIKVAKLLIYLSCLCIRLTFVLFNFPNQRIVPISLFFIMKMRKI